MFGVIMGPNVYYTDVPRSSVWLLLLPLFLLAACDRTPQPPLVDRPAPEFSVQDSGRTVALKDLRGKVVVLNFWATWCPPCVDELPSLVAMQRQMKDQVTVFAVSMDDDEEAYRQFLVEHKVDLLTVRDSSRQSALLYGTVKYPETYIIDPEGIVRRKYVGPVDWTQPAVLQYLARTRAGFKEAPSAVAANSR
jgi:cytochrome c biogenesis protein CcmG/thiol:disulfide interchange protein DsbE